MKNIVIAGVGGQGTLLSSVILGQVALKLGYDVKISEVHGMAQRGGSVVTYVRIGDKGEKVYSPIIDPGQADILLGFEQLETLRWLPYAGKDCKIYSNTQQILPMPVITGAAKYPDDIPGTVKKHFDDAVFVDALSLAVQAGSVRAVNVVLLGVMAKEMDIDEAVWMDVIGSTVKPAFKEINEKAFLLGNKEVI